MRATCPTHLTLIEVIIQVIFGEQYRAGSSLLYNLLHSPGTAPRPTRLKHPSPVSLNLSEIPSFKPIQKNRQNYSSVYFNLPIFCIANCKTEYSAPNYSSVYFNLPIFCIANCKTQYSAPNDSRHSQNSFCS